MRRQIPVEMIRGPRFTLWLLVAQVISLKLKNWYKKSAFIGFDVIVLNVCKASGLTKLNNPIHFHFSFDNSQFSPNLCSRFDKLFRPPAVFVMSRRDPRSAFRSPRSGRQTAVQSTAVFAFKRRFLARGSRFFHGATLIWQKFIFLLQFSTFPLCLLQSFL